MTQAELHPLYQQMGEIIRGLRALGETIDGRQNQAEKLHDLMRSDVIGLRQHQRDSDEKLDCVICVMQNDLEKLRADVGQNAALITDLLLAVNNLSRPVSEIMTLRSRAAGLIMGLGIFGSVVIWLAEPVYRWFVVDRLLPK